MLILTRTAGESIVIGDDITITILDTGGSVRVGIEAPRDTEIHREEVYRLIVGETDNPTRNNDTFKQHDTGRSAQQPPKHPRQPV